MLKTAARLLLDIRKGMGDKCCAGWDAVCANARSGSVTFVAVSRTGEEEGSRKVTESIVTRICELWLPTVDMTSSISVWWEYGKEMSRGSR